MGNKFYKAWQNNSGGYLIINDDVSMYLVIEESSLERANKKLKEVTKNYSDYCECCGPRWDTLDEHDEIKTLDEVIPEFYFGMLSEELSYVLYKADGTKEKVVLKESTRGW